MGTGPRAAIVARPRAASYGAAVPTFATALGLGLGAAWRNAWLVAAGFAVGLVRQLAGWPALAVAGVLLSEGALQAARASPFDAWAPLAGALAVASAPRFVGLVAGLLLAGGLLGGALRLAWLAGAFPTLAADVAGARDGAPRFAAGVAYGLPHVLAAAMLGLVADLAATGFSLAVALAALQVGLAEWGGATLPVAALAALALSAAVAVPIALSVATDAAVARAAVRGEGPARAFAGAARAFLARPGSFLLLAMTFGFATFLALSSVDALGGAVVSYVGIRTPAAVLGPQLMVGAAAALAVAALELWRAGALAALACGDPR